MSSLSEIVATKSFAEYRTEFQVTQTLHIFLKGRYCNIHTYNGAWLQFVLWIIPFVTNSYRGSSSRGKTRLYVHVIGFLNVRVKGPFVTYSGISNSFLDNCAVICYPFLSEDCEK